MQTLLILLLIRRCSADALFGGIIYLHDITIRRPTFGPSWPINYLTIPEPVDHVLLTTSKWDQIPHEFEDAAAREGELKASAWKRIVKASGPPCRFFNTQESAWKIVDTLLALVPVPLDVLQQDIQRTRTLFARRAPRKSPGEGFFSFLFGLFGHSQVCIQSWSVADITHVYLKGPKLTLHTEHPYMLDITPVANHQITMFAIKDDQPERSI